jgi:hypothetical protein
LSDILIKGMEMPKGCWWYDDDLRFHECWLTKVCHYHLTVGLYDNEYPDAEKSESCPLVEVPTHGLLKDWEKIKEIFSKYLPQVDDETNALLCEVMTDIGMNAPTVLEASKERECLEPVTLK